MRRLTLALIAAALLLIAGCGEDDGDGGADATRVPGPSDALVAYERSGGEEGLRERLDVRPDGAARMTVNGKAERFELTPRELDELRAAARGVAGGKLERVYGHEPAPLDTYETRVLTGGRLVRLVHGADPPPALDRLLRVCAELIRRHSPR